MNTTSEEQINTTRENIVEQPLVSEPKIVEPMERESTEQVILDLEQKGYYIEIPKAIKKVNQGKSDIGNALLDIIKNGSDEFKQRTGRPMSYTEMRAAYG